MGALGLEGTPHLLLHFVEVEEGCNGVRCIAMCLFLRHSTPCLRRLSVRKDGAAGGILTAAGCLLRRGEEHAAGHAGDAAAGGDRHGDDDGERRGHDAHSLPLHIDLRAAGALVSSFSRPDHMLPQAALRLPVCTTSTSTAAVPVPGSGLDSDLSKWAATPGMGTGSRAMCAQRSAAEELYPNAARVA